MVAIELRFTYKNLISIGLPPLSTLNYWLSVEKLTNIDYKYCKGINNLNIPRSNSQTVHTSEDTLPLVKIPPACRERRCRQRRRQSCCRQRQRQRSDAGTWRMPKAFKLRHACATLANTGEAHTACNPEKGWLLCLCCGGWGSEWLQ